MSYYASSTMFVHTHNFEWGKVTHSHPCIPQSGHSHSAAACSVVDSMGGTFFIVAYSSLVLALFIAAYRYVIIVEQKAQSQCELIYGLRAPPVC